MKPLKYLLLIVLPLFIFSCKKATMFEKISSSHSGIKFNNEIVENDTINPLDKLNIYNGGGVGIGDFNNDGLQDIYFVGNAVSNRLYINKGDFKFDDVTEKAGVGGKGGWGRGVAVVDINNDGLKDIYVCNTLLNDSVKRLNLLYINQGVDKNGVPVFKESSKEYGLDINIHSTMASFFDYDNDGDLDMYLTVNEAQSTDNTSSFRPILKDGSSRSTGRLYRNDYDPKLKHGVYTNVSKQAGILIEGYGHAASIVDINRDGWKDIYVTNDFLPSNILYINNHDGTFTDRTQEYFKHTATSAMGQDIQDINNDGLADVFELDMDPEDNYRKKMFMPGTAYQLYQNFDTYGYQYQYNHNTLQLNQGPRLGQNDSIGAPAFSEVAFLSGVAQTDWSWGPMITDFDNDGFRDIVVTNGYPRDVTDHDFIVFRNESYIIASKKQILQQIPIVKISNYAFRNNGRLQFEDVTKNWGIDIPSFSNGAAYADLDNDGAMDMIINNIDDEAFIYKNTSREKDKNDNHYLQIQFKGNPQNKDGIGAWADIYYDHGKHQVYENTPFRGYLSTIQDIAHFGLGKVANIDSVVIKWTNGKQQTLTNVKTDQLLKVDINNAKTPYNFNFLPVNSQSLFAEVTKSVGINYKHNDVDFSDFNVQKLLPHKLSEYAPAVAVGDVDGNGFDDMVVGGTSKYPAQLFLQQASGKFIQRNLLTTTQQPADKYKDEGLLLFDADGDGDLDLYVASGGYEAEPNSKQYQDRVYANDGKGNFALQADALPANFTSKLCVKAVDYNKDGTLDLFVSGRVDPWNYPKPVSSFILRNESKKGHIKFSDVTSTVAKGLKNLGLVCDASFTDYDNDGWPDLVITGEWMPVTFMKNDHGIFKNETPNTGIANKFGWWNTITGGDFDHDGDIDYIVGNTGLNTFYKGTDEYPAYITAKDFDNNDSYDAIPSLFLKDKQGVMKEFPAHTRDDIVKQIISMRVKFQNYKSYAVATMDSVITPDMRKGAVRLKANELRSCYMRNDGHGKFTMIPLPIEAQMSQLAGIIVDDFDGDGNLDVVLNGNDYGTEVSTGRYDAFNGLLLKGDGKGGFKPLSIMQSGIYIPGDGKALVKLRSAKGNYLLAATQYKDALKVFELKKPVTTVSLQPLDMFAIIKYKNGKTAKQEFYNGGSFLSQSGRFFNIDSSMASVSITDNAGHTRNIPLK
ncbi:VCBS repeat-containing protein [Mucilaginibacter sp. 14171R-50]|uniref:VCBS repeat-containing protein n=1 Tax=Mucilaginibacter sp. 14171R-50 TaxID=2703789 RepID=UPI00138B4B48|nr:VCBS repeat-containing protein [Mucilaginibacter sp. 14171R-50]QHS56235.1 VCBS repeat-containing protein [Mucilaginibacter sp. 14171R-50]